MVARRIFQRDYDASVCLNRDNATQQYSRYQREDMKIENRNRDSVIDYSKVEKAPARTRHSWLHISIDLKVLTKEGCIIP